MEKQMNDKVNNLRNDAENQEELMKALAQIDEDGQLTDDVLDAVSGGGGLSAIRLGTGIDPTMGVFPTNGGDKPVL